MYRPDDKDIDRISREAAEHYNAPGEPTWDALRGTLDKELPVEKEKRRRGFFFWLLLLLGLSVAGTGTWYGVYRNQEKKTSASVGNQNMPAGKISAETAITQKASPGSSTAHRGDSRTPASEAGQPAAATAAAITDDNPRNKEQAAASGNEPVVKAAVANKSRKPESVTASRPSSTLGTHVHSVQLQRNDAPTAPPRSRIGRPESTSNANAQPIVTKGNRRSHHPLADAIPAQDPGISLSNPSGKNKHERAVPEKNSPEASTDASSSVTTTTADNQASGKKTVPVPADESNKQADAGLDNKSHPVPVISSATPAATTADSNAHQPIAAAVTKKKHPAKKQSAIRIGLTGGIDLSTVKFTHSDNPGYNIGLMAGYEFNKHWSVYTGAIYTKKDYNMDGADYHPPKHYWTQYVELQTVDGYCRMWEVPLEARYTFNSRSRNAVFVSAGFSSYFMKKQAYDYTYKASGVPGFASWSNDSTFNHVFSILHVSAGIERSVGKHVNLQVEPYAKIPLGGVGFGNIRLSSFGINFSVQYRQPVKR